MKYLITGSAGFIGKALTEKLRAMGHQTLSFDIVDQGGDIRNLENLTQTCGDVDGIFHLAAHASVQYSLENPLSSFETNVSGTLNIFEAARVNGGIPVVYASSAAIYGDFPDLPLEETAPSNPLSPYAMHKKMNEDIANNYGKNFKVASFGLRFFNIYGPGQNPHSPYAGVISIFQERLQTGSPVTLYGDGFQSRDFVYIDDATAALCLAMDKASPESPVCNICTGKSTSILDLVNILSKHMDSEARIDLQDARPGDIKHSVGSPALFEKLTGYTPGTSVEDGLKSLIENT